MPAPPSAAQPADTAEQPTDTTAQPADATAQPADTTAQPADATRQSAADERQIHPVDGRVISLAHGKGKLEFGVGWPKEARGQVQHDWVGMFMADGQEVPGSRFKLTVVGPWGARAELVAEKLPSEAVRLFPPGYRGRF
ncbi:MAG TPA: hypothetical protein VFP84_04180 [Kofleriaceae bacterium]|nr:hypothetical protein [Kofleriaceae bacterium]